jgi:hypothetical protein
MSPTPLLPGRLAWTAATALAVALGVLTGCSSAQSSSVPPLSSPAPGEFRVSVTTNQSVPMSYTPETLPGGTKINIGIGPSSIHTVNGKLTAFFGLQYPGEQKDQAYGGFWLSAGQSHVVGARYRFAVLQIWDDAANVQVTSIG